MIDYNDYKRVPLKNGNVVIKYHLYCDKCNKSKGYQTKDKNVFQCRSCSSSRTKTLEEKEKIRKGVIEFYAKKHNYKKNELLPKKHRINNYKEPVWSRIKRDCIRRDKKYKIDTRYNLTDTEIKYFLNQNCFYCGNGNSIGLDRIDNSKGHSKDNVVSCCKICNMTRGDRFTKDEFIKIGFIIKEILNNRTK